MKASSNLGGWDEDGMSLRDWFAGQALTGMLAHAYATTAIMSAQDAYALADAMLIQRRALKPRKKSSKR